jgi:cytochrome c oxidase subunit I+III
MIVAIPLMIAAPAIETLAHMRAGVSPAQSSYGAIVYATIGVQGFFTAIVVTMALYCVVRARAGLLDRERRLTFDSTMLLWHYTVVQGVASIALVHGFPRLIN